MAPELRLGPVEVEVQRALAALGEGALPARRRAEDLIAAVLALYGNGLRRAVELARASAADRVRSTWSEEPAVAELLTLHSASGPHPAPADATAARRAGGTVDAICEELAATPAGEAAPTMAAMVLVVELHGRCLAQMMASARDAGADALVRRLGADDLVASLLLAHGVHPDSLEVRLAAVLAELDRHRGPVAEVELVDVAPDRVRLRVRGSTPRDAWRLRLAVERAIDERLPDLEAVEIEGGDEPVADTSVSIPLDSLTVRRSDGSRAPLGSP